MALVGDLGSVDLGQVFQVLAQNQKDGVLEVARSQDHRGLRFRRGTVTLQYDRDVYEERVVELLTLLGRLSPETLQLAAANGAASGEAILDVLVGMKILSEDEVLTLLRERMAEELYDLFAWMDARFEFYEGASQLDAVEGVVDERLCFPTDAVVMEAARRLDEWSRIRASIPDDREVYLPAVAELLPEDDLQAAVFAQVDGARCVDDILRNLGRSRFEVAKTLARLVETGAVRALAPAEYPEQGKRALDASRAREAANLFDRAVEYQQGLPSSTGFAAQAWEMAGDRIAAVERYVAYGDLLVQAHRPDEALRAYRRGHELIPTDLAAWKRAVLVALDLEDLHPGRHDLDPEATGAQALAEVCFEVGQTDLGVEVLERVVARHPRDIEAKRALIGALDGPAHAERVCQLLDAVAQDLAMRGDTVAAAACLQRALRLQPRRRDLTIRIRELYKRDEKKRSRVRLMTALAVSAVLLAGVGFLVYSREQRARADLAALAIEDLVRDGDYDQARLILDEYYSSHPLTFTVREADALMMYVEDAARAAKDKEQQRKNQEYADRRKRLEEATMLAAKADDLARGGDLHKALAGLRKALAQAPPDWDQAEAVRANAEALEGYLAGAREIAASAAQSAEAQDWASMRDHVRELLAKYPRSPEGVAARFPVLVETTPAGAAIFEGGEALRAAGGAVARTPAVVLLAPAKAPRTLEARLAGFEPATLSVDPVKDAEARLRLGRAPESARSLPAAVNGDPVEAGGHAIVPLVGGRLAAFDAEGAEPAWVASLSTSGEVALPPVCVGDSVLAATSDGALTSLRASDGTVRWRVVVPGGVRVLPLALDEGVVAAGDDGVVRLLDRDSGERRREWRAGPRPAGACAVGGGRLYVGLADGRIRVIQLDDPRADDAFLPFGARVASLALAGGTLVATGDDGRIAGLDVSGTGSSWDFPGGRIAAPRLVVAKGRVIVDRAGQLVALDPRTGATLASADRRLEPSGSLALFEDLVFASLRDGSVVALGVDDLVERWHWPGPASAPDRAHVVVASHGRSLVAASARTLYRFEATGSSAAPQSSSAAPKDENKNR